MSRVTAIDANRVPTDAAALDSILFTEELYRRPSRLPDYSREGQALVALTQALANSPENILQIIADMILEIFQAGSAGISLLAMEENGKSFYWLATSGKWKPHMGGGMSRDIGPFGDALDREKPLLFQRIERRYKYFKPVTPPMEESLLVPFYVDGESVGTIWAVAHDDTVKFDAEDERVMTSLAKFASAAYQITTSIETLKLEALRQANHAQELSKLLLDAEDEERRHIARELHDSTGQKIAVLIMDLAQVRREKGSLRKQNDTLKECQFLAIQISDEIRSLSYVLHPPLLDELGLVTAVRVYAEGINKRHILEVNLEVDAKPARLPPDVEIALFRVIQAALANVHHHSRSKMVTVRIVQDLEKIELEIIDQGHGFKLTGDGVTIGGIGLLGIQERLQFIGGRLEIETGDNGTVLRGIVPLAMAQRF
jgi:signal transduction histidine kinase